ncbi:histidine kinase [Pseudomonas daroniae]|uniref:Histidine kinase n=1 Tax=Phytopseudomonas daroniae TaxID=2487519 RepID=A0A4V2KAA9_9GAMM|nr:MULTISPECIES: LuxR C-terminal-related transcriptional regulator [Pseudomonas]TBU73109.1 histidine kinase [Pseudomonas daroniae]TBU77845.1 histidine kinase [Pseudomonas sp. FRB 228]TBU87881.1 histidine kinase [Pseudomonas daroniae]
MRAAGFAPAPAAVSNALTEREEQTLQLIAAGNSNKQIARELGISDGTVKIYVRSLLRKFHLHSRLELASWVHRHTGMASASAQGAVGPAGVAGLINDLPVLIYRGDNARTWYMDYVSEGCLQLTGYSAEYLTRDPAHSFGSLILTEYADYVWYCVQCALLKHEPFQLRYRICCADGRIKEVCETGVGVYSASGEVLGVEGAIFEAAS